MTLINTLRIAGVSTLLFACAGIVAAQGPTASANLEMSATVQTAVQLNISTAVIPAGAAVTGAAGSGAFVLDFGNVNGLGIGTPTTGVSVVVDATGALYSTPINVTPVFSGFTTETAGVGKTAGTDGDEDIAREGSTALNMIAPATTAAAFAGATSGSTNIRYVGFRIDRTEVAGVKEATIIYDVIVN